MSLKLSIYIIVVALILSLTSGFRVPTCRQSTRLQKLQMSDTGSDGALVDKALDSALDFLQDGEGETDSEEVDEFDMFDIFEDSPDFEIPHDLIRELEIKESQASAGKGPSQAAIHDKERAELIKKWQRHPSDVGSAEVQVAIADWKVKYLTTHLLNNKHDKSALRGLQAHVVRRRKFMNYLHDQNPEKADKMIAELGIRWRQPGELWNKQAKYAAYKNTKSKWEKLRRDAKQEKKDRAAAAADRLANA